MSSQLPPGPTQQPWQPYPMPPTQSRTSRGLVVTTVLALVLGLAGVIVGVVAIATRPDVPEPPPLAGPPTYTAEEVAAAKTEVCEQFEAARRGVIRTSNLTADPGENKPVLDWVNAAHARIALVNGAYLLTSSVHPAAPKDLTDAVRELATAYDRIVTDALAGQANTDADFERNRQSAIVATDRVDSLCE